MLSLKVHTNIKTSQCVVTKNHMGKKKKSNIGPLRTVLQVTLANDHPVELPDATLHSIYYTLHCTTLQHSETNTVNNAHNLPSPIIPYTISTPFPTQHIKVNKQHQPLKPARGLQKKLVLWNAYLTIMFFVFVFCFHSFGCFNPFLPQVWNNIKRVSNSPIMLWNT